MALVDFHKNFQKRRMVFTKKAVWKIIVIEQGLRVVDIPRPRYIRALGTTGSGAPARVSIKLFGLR